MRVIVKTHI